MVVGVAKIELFFPEPNSLKAKRQILKALMQKIESNFKKVSVAEVDGHDHWQRTIIGVSLVGRDQPFVDSRLTSLVDFIQHNSALEIIKVEIDYLNY